MVRLLGIEIHWLSLAVLGLILLLVYFLLRLLKQLVENTALLGKHHQKAEQASTLIIVLYQPLAILTFLGTLVLMDPVVHGILVGLLFAATFHQVRNYFSGRLVLLGKDLKVGSKVKIQDYRGSISKLGTLGLQLRSSSGLHYIGYHDVLSHGYTLYSGQESSRIISLDILNLSSNLVEIQQLEDLVASAPYLSHDYQPELLQDPIGQKPLRLRVVLKAEHYLTPFVALLRAQGYEVELGKSKAQ
jgi:hypothetical protein